MRQPSFTARRVKAFELGRSLTRTGRKLHLERRLRVGIETRRAGAAGQHLVPFSCRRGRVTLSCVDAMVVDRQELMHHRLLGLLPLIAGVPHDGFAAIADISDGEDSGPGLLSYCSRDPEAILIPDHEFVESHGYRDVRQAACANPVRWSARSNVITWRGAATGVGSITTETLGADDPTLRQRVRLCLVLKGMPGTDVKVTGAAPSASAARDMARLAEAGILGDFIDPLRWLAFKFAIDIDGYSNAWSNLFTRLLIGCCVLKVESPRGFRQWYYDDLEPWVHYVPVKGDLSDLRDKIGWSAANSDECEKIAARGQAFALERDYDFEIAAAVRRLGEAEAAGRLQTSLGT